MIKIEGPPDAAMADQEINQNFFQQLVTSQSNHREICLSLVTDITRGQLTVLKFVECLEGIISHEDLTIRRGGVDILTTVLSELPEDALNATEIKNFVNFYCSQLVDHHSYIPFVLKGFLAMVQMKQLPDHVISKIFTAINLNFTCQSQPLADRRLCYQLMQEMIERKPAELQALGPDFVCGYLSIIDSERDPRNLLMLFKNLPLFFKNFPLGHLAEDAFEAVSCYFPIDFRSNAKDPRGITREDLSNALMPCLTASEKFHTFAIELALEKFASDLEIAKMDSLILMKQCFSDFPSDKTSASSLLIVPVLVNEMKPGKTSFEIQQLCADVTAHILKHLYFHNEFDIGGKIISLVYSDLETFINDIDLSFFLPTIRLLSKVATSCNTACHYLASRVVKKLFYSSLQSKTQVLVALECLDLLLIPCTAHKIDCEDVFGSTWKQVIKLLLDTIENSSRETLMAAFTVCTSIISLFNKEQKRVLYLQLLKRVKSEEDLDIWKKSADCLRLLAKVYPEDVKNLIDSELTSPNYHFSFDDYERRLFEFWCVLAPVSGFATYLNSAIRLHLQYSSNKFLDFVVKSLRNLLVREKSNKFFLDILHNEIKLTDCILNWWNAGNSALPDSSSLFDNEQIAKNITCLITIIVRSLNEKNQTSLAVNFFKLMVDCSQRFMNSFNYLDSTGDLNSPDLHCSLSIISFEAIMNGIRPKVLTETLDKVLPQIVNYLTTVSVYCSRSFCCLVACRCLATITNKFLHDSSLQPQIEFLFTSVDTIFTKNKVPFTINAVNVLFYLTRSLVYRNHADLNRCLDMLLVVLPNDDIHTSIENGFRTLAIEDEYFFNTSSHFRIEPGFRERLFSSAVPKLLEISKSGNKSVKHVCTVSIVCLLVETTHNIFATYLKEIIPLFMSVLVNDEPADIVVPTLNKISSMLEENPVAFEEYVETFLSKLTSLGRYGKFMKMRVAALQCLSQFAKLNPPVILPFKTKVSQELLLCLDDKKRLVRQEAVKTRSKWLVLGST